MRCPSVSDALRLLELNASGVQELTQIELRRAFRQQALKWHPDKNVGQEALAADAFQGLTAAYNVLSQHLLDPVGPNISATSLSSDEQLLDFVFSDEFFRKALERLSAFDIIYLQGRMHERHSHTSTRRSPHGQQPSFQESNMQPIAPQQQAATDTFSQVRPAGGSMNGHAQHAVGTADAVVQGMHSRCSEADALARVDCGPERDFSRPQQQSGACASCSSVDGCKPLHQQTRDYGGVSVQGQSQHAHVNFRTNTAQFSPWPQALREQQSVQDNGCCVWQETADDLSDLWAMVQRYLRRKRLRAGGVGQRQRQQQAAPSSTQQKWRVLWEFVTEMLSEPADSLDSHPVQGDTAAASCPQQHHDVSPSANAHASFLYEPSSQDVHEPAVAGLAAMIEGKDTAESMAGMHWIEAAREAELGQRRKRLSLGFYWAWVKRLLLARIVVGLLSNR